MSKILISTVSILIALFATQCGAAPVPSEKVTINDNASNLMRTYDREAGVVCYHFYHHSDLSCLPIDETRLK